MRGAACNRADLVRALAAGGEALLEASAALLGYERRPEAAAEAQPRPPTRPPERVSSRVPEAAPSQAAEAAAPASVPLADVPFWRATRLTVRDGRASAALPERKPVTWAGRPGAGPARRPLAPVGALLPRLRRAVAVVRVSRRVDVDAVVRRLGRGRDLAHVPRVRRQRWGHGLHVVCDRSTRLTPYWGDQDRVLLALSRLYPAGGLEIVVCDETGMLFSTSRPRLGRLAPPPPGTRTLVLSDLGGLDVLPERRATLAWAALGRRLAASGLAPAALLPCRAERLATAPPRGFRLASHERSWAASGAPRSGAALTDAAEQLLTWLAPAVRIQPELLRQVRLELGQGAIHAGVESIVWQHSGAATRHPDGLSLQPAEVQKYRERFAAADADVRRAALAIMRSFRGGPLPESIWFEEVLGLDRESRHLVPAEDLEAATAYVRHETLPRLLAPRGSDPVRPWAARWLGALAERLPAQAWTPDEARVLRQAWLAAYGDRGPHPAPFVVDPQEVLSSSGWPERRVHVAQAGSALVFVPADEPLGLATSPLATLRAGFPRIRLERGPGFWQAGEPPSWASAWGRDAFGPWVEIELGGMRQRLRWIPAGRFRMGSPRDEPGRYGDEGPQHEVTIGQGFWLFDTPCTQALWEAVMGKNPSRFRTPDRPVEQVSWEDCKKFLARMNERVPGLHLVLPSEAQWEYACRAGTETATYAGPLEILGQNNAPVLDDVGWYAGNSGKDFDLEDGHDSSDWPEKQHQHTKAGTRPVGRKRANAWGLYDMLGNVWEWVEDDWHDQYDGAPVDGTAWVDSQRGSARVVRGGSWNGNARAVRAACRVRVAPGNRGSDLGLRCARVQDREQPAEPAGPEDRSAERRSSGGPATSVDVWVGPGGDHPQPLEAAPRLVLQSDRETVEVERLTRPHWASAIGRDRAGLWTEFELSARAGTVAQRLRWIPPGRLRMGSPADEPGRWEDGREGPQHEVTIERGFWLFDTPCTQALWEAVMGQNPSYFRTPDRPVEQVSWEDCRKFLARVNEQVPGLGLVLPSEAQWEYACRAGTETATYAGPLEILGENNAPVLDEIAWYAGNSGAGFELENGWDSSDWKDKQYQHTRAGTRPVGRKRANAWGLYDMLGNVWEWVEDDWHDTYEGAPVDGSAWVDSRRGSARVVRGGSWYDDAWSVRAACRNRLAPGNRDCLLGLRCARVQDQEQPAEPAGPREDRSAERRSDAARPEESGRRGTRRPARPKQK